MKHLVVVVMSIALIVGLSSLAGADLFGPNGEGNPWYALAIPEEYIPEIDGDLSDWAWMPTEYVFTPDFFASFGNFTDAEAAVPKDDFDVLIYGPCWIPANNMMAFAVNKVDDILYGPSEDVYAAHAEDCIQWATDADHGHDEAGDGSQYQQNFFTPKAGGYAGVFTGGGTKDWINNPPNGFWAANIQDNGTFDFEIMMKMWDVAGDGELGDTPAGSIEHILEEHQIVGFSVEICDADSDSEIEFPDVEFDFGNVAEGGAVLPNYYLLPLSETVAVQGSTWGAIKATFDR
jgi:hypothetical protein